MKNYKTNINDYVEEDFTKEESYKCGEEMTFLPEEENEANFCTLEKIEEDNSNFNIQVFIENEWTGERYRKTYKLQEGSRLELNMLTPNLACFLPPNRVPVLAEITAISSDSLSIKPVGVSEEYAELMDRKNSKIQIK